MSAQPITSFTPEEYLALERQRKYKSEYLDGQIYALVGGSQRHSLLVVNIVAALHGQLRQRTCSVYPSDMRVHVPSTRFYAYPDVSIACEPIQLADSHQDTLLNPVVIIEVLSKSTENYDRGRKFKLYRALPSLGEYLLVSQESLHIEHFVRQPDNQWLSTDVDDPQATIHLATVGCDLALADVYEQIDLDPQQ